MGLLKAVLVGVTATIFPPAAAVMVAKSAMDKWDEEKDNARKEGYTSGYKRGYRDAMAKVERVLAEATQEEQIHFVYSAVALGMIAAKADGDISEEEIDELSYLVGNIKKQGYSDTVVNTVNWIIDNCDTFSQARQFLDDVSADKIEVLNDLIKQIIQADDYVDPAEEDLYDQWVDYANYRLRNA